MFWVLPEIWKHFENLVGCSRGVEVNCLNCNWWIGAIRIPGSNP